jgi:hypothetical protein|tara:strand:- start:702 stop:863 length:162 start_codon:yes stop_codon:yes gene_type:complete
VKRKKKYYLIVSKRNNWRYGAFDYSEEGKMKAENYLKTLKVKTGDKTLEIVEK